MCVVRLFTVIIRRDRGFVNRKTRAVSRCGWRLSCGGGEQRHLQKRGGAAVDKTIDEGCIIL